MMRYIQNHKLKRQIAMALLLITYVAVLVFLGRCML